MGFWGDMKVSVFHPNFTHKFTQSLTISSYGLILKIFRNFDFLQGMSMKSHLKDLLAMNLPLPCTQMAIPHKFLLDYMPVKICSTCNDAVLFHEDYFHWSSRNCEANPIDRYSMFVKFCSSGLHTLGLHNSADIEFSGLWKQVEPFSELIGPYWTLWTARGSVLEILLLLDRLLFLQESRNMTSSGGSVTLGNDTIACVLEIGRIELKMTCGKTLVLDQVQHVPEVRRNLVSGSYLIQRGFKVVMERIKL
ncbi:Methyltranfer dom domain-containing protein [Abeliophyllum distichum]|uniref:Methyltranfer dom domain-containing protein n=1 Tax=Abeliophyllum distichum TaxID=126358 RepID=A0ABD1UQJ2_9LAMI